MLRETIDCSAVVMWQAVSTGSIETSGLAPCAPLPSTRMSKKAPPAETTFRRTAKCPSGKPGRLCMAKIASQGKRSNSRSSSIASAPPQPSSPGWKMKWTMPSKFLVCARYCAAPSSMVVCPSWPQACIFPGTWLA